MYQWKDTTYDYIPNQFNSSSTKRTAGLKYMRLPDRLIFDGSVLVEPQVDVYINIPSEFNNIKLISNSALGGSNNVNVMISGNRIHIAGFSTSNTNVSFSSIAVSYSR